MRRSTMRSVAALALAVACAACAGRGRAADGNADGAGTGAEAHGGRAGASAATEASAAADAGRAGASTAADTAHAPAQVELKYDVHPTAAVQLHLVPQVGFVPPVPDMTVLSCDALNVASPFTGAHAVHVLVSGLERPTAANFGIEYPSTIRVTHWTTAAPGVEITSEEWPATGSWIALAFGAGAVGNGELAHVGTLSLAPGAKGTLRIIGVSEDENHVKIVDTKRTEWIVNPTRLAVGAFGVSGGTTAPCE